MSMDTNYANILTALHAAGANQMATIEYTADGTDSRTYTGDTSSGVFTFGGTDAYASFNWDYQLLAFLPGRRCGRPPRKPSPRCPH